MCMFYSCSSMTGRGYVITNQPDRKLSNAQSCMSSDKSTEPCTYIKAQKKKHFTGK